MGLPKVVAVLCPCARLVGRAVVEQPAVHDELPVGTVQSESETVRREITVQMQRAPVSLPTLELVETLLQGFVSKCPSVFLRFAEPLFAVDYHRD